MTLDTRIYVIDPVNVEELFAEGQRLLSLYDEEGRGADRQITSHSDDGRFGRLANRLGQGLPAILDISYGIGGPFRSAESAAVHEYCNHPDAEDGDFEADEPVCAEVEHRPVCWAEISLDTAYGYQGPNGLRCGDLHALLVAGFGQWFDARNVGWRWLNEFTGDVHEGYESLRTLSKGGAEAVDWFQTLAFPAIVAHAAASGGQVSA